MVQCFLNEQPIHETFLAHIFQIWHPIQIPKLVPRMVELPELDQKHIYRTIHFSRNYAFLGLFHGIILMSKTNTPEFHY
ncbi:hypothetical protein Gotur_001865 [Gossypium turneri]